jgi:sulfate transport system permease protein
LLEHGIRVAYTPLGIVLALAFVGFPFVVRTVQPVLADVPRDLGDAARGLGASPLAVIARVTVPLALPAIATGFALAFARTLGEYGSVVFIAGNSRAAPRSCRCSCSLTSKSTIRPAPRRSRRSCWPRRWCSCWRSTPCSGASCGFTPVRERGRGTSALLVVLPLALVLGVLIVVPLVAVAAGALATGAGALPAALREPGVSDAVLLSLGAALVALAFNAAFGLLAGWTIAKYRFPGKAGLVTLIDAPLTVSPVIVGLAVLATLGQNTPAGVWLAAHGLRVAFAPAGVAVATTLVTFPYVARAVIAQMSAQGRVLEEAALGLGASAWQTFARITLPLSRASFLNGLLICNARALGEFGAVTVVSGNVRGLTQTVPLQIADFYDGARMPAAFALAAALAALAIVLALTARLFARRDPATKGLSA